MSVENLTKEEAAALLIHAVKNELKRGTKHFDIDGKPLETAESVLQALVKDGRVIIGAKE
jgi:hypothetical protein